MEPKRSGKARTILQRLKLRLRNKDYHQTHAGGYDSFVMPRSAAARPRAGFHRDPRSRMNRQLSRQHVLFLARFRNEALSERTALVGAIIQPTTYRLKMSRITYR